MKVFMLIIALLSFTPSFDLSLSKTVTEQNHSSGNNDRTLEIVLYCSPALH